MWLIVILIKQNNKRKKTLKSNPCENGKDTQFKISDVLPERKKSHTRKRKQIVIHGQ